MTQTLYSRDHEYVRIEDGVATIGITAHAAQALGDLVYVELPEPGRELAAGEAAAVVESVKAASDVYAPVAGRVVEANAALADDPALGNSDPEGAAWFFKLRLAEGADLSGLLDAAAYEVLLGESV
jgi:glycine cleavage system H protein